MDSRTGILPVIRLEQPFVGWVEREPFVGWVERQRNPTLGVFVLLPLMLGCVLLHPTYKKNGCSR
ncbi:MAG: hypothetical protein SXA11_21090 [Cyanobacteriota bacterium]|nr:hypothetical protein [Cyanobacteriota bacterium]